MFRALSKRRNPNRYEQLDIGDAAVDDLSSEAKTTRCTMSPTNYFGDSPVTFESELRTPVHEFTVDKKVKKASKVHPIFAIFERKGRRKKATAKPEFSRYMQYLKEGGIWSANESKPVIN